jgi:nicotine blue oxidoreductase
VVIAREHWDALLATLHGDEGARAFLRARADVVGVECGDLARGVDVDTE